LIIAESKAAQEYYQPKKKNAVIKGQKSRNRGKLRAILKLGIVLIIGVIIISRFAIISEYSYRINRLESEFGELRKVNERLHLQLAQAQDITLVEEYARDRLGMVYPENTDIVYVAVDRIDEEVAAVQQINEEKYGIKGWVAVLAGKMCAIISGD